MKFNIKKINLVAFSLPPILTSIISTVHIITWWGLSNPLIWAIFLAFVIEIGALSSLAALTTLDSKNKTTIMIIFGLITLMQIIGNVYFSYEYIATQLISNPEFLTNWINLTEPIFSLFMSVSVASMHRVLAYVAGMLLPLISLSFLHILVNYVQKTKNIEIKTIEQESVYTQPVIEHIVEQKEQTSEKTVKKQVKNKKNKSQVKPKTKKKKNESSLEEPIYVIEEVSEEVQTEPIITRDKQFTYVDSQNLQDKKPIKRPIS